MNICFCFGWGWLDLCYFVFLVFIENVKNKIINVLWYEMYVCLINSFGYNGWIFFCNFFGIIVSLLD